MEKPVISPDNCYGDRQALTEQEAGQYRIQ